MPNKKNLNEGYVNIDTTKGRVQVTNGRTLVTGGRTVTQRQELAPPRPGAPIPTPIRDNKD